MLASPRCRRLCSNCSREISPLRFHTADFLQTKIRNFARDSKLGSNAENSRLSQLYFFRLLALLSFNQRNVASRAYCRRLRVSLRLYNGSLACARSFFLFFFLLLAIVVAVAAALRQSLA